MWRMPRPMTATLPSGESQLFSDSSSDSSAEDSQDPDLDSLTPVQSLTPATGASGPRLTDSLIISHTTVEVYSTLGPSMDTPTLSPCPTGPAGDSPSSSPLEEDTESDTSFASLNRRLKQVHSNFPSSSLVLKGTQAGRPSFLASSSIRSFSARSPRLPMLQGSDLSSAGDFVPSRPIRSTNIRRSLPTSAVRSRIPDRRSSRTRPSLPSRLETLTNHYLKQGFSRIAIQIFKNGNADSTHRAYESAWSLFREYLSFKRIHPTRITSSDIFNFLAYHRRVNNRQYRTLAKYRAAIKLPIKAHSKIDLDSRHILKLTLTQISPIYSCGV